MSDKKKEEFLDSNLDENQEPANLENDFLKEIHQKINKRSGGLYYNKKLKSIKKNLSITSFVVVFVIILWALINFISQKVSVSPDVKSNKTTVETHGRASLQGNKNEIKKERIRYLFTKSKDFDIKNTKILKKVLKKYNKVEAKGYYIYNIPDTEIKNVLQVVLNMKLTLVKEKYSDISKDSQISIKKDLLD